MSRLDCRNCSNVNRERLHFPADNPHSTKRFAYEVAGAARRRRSAMLPGNLWLDWGTLAQQGNARSGSTRSRCARATTIESWSPTSTPTPVIEPGPVR